MSQVRRVLRDGVVAKVKRGLSDISLVYLARCSASSVVGLSLSTMELDGVTVVLHSAVYSLEQQTSRSYFSTD